MMKGSTNAQSNAPRRLLFSEPYRGQGWGGHGRRSEDLSNIINFLSPSNWGQGSRAAGTGSKGAAQPQANISQPQEGGMNIPAMPAYVNYQQTPIYSSQPVAPSNALTQFLSSGYASGGSVDLDSPSSLEDDIKAALRLARLIGELTKKE